MTDAPLPATFGVTPTYGAFLDRSVAKAIQYCTATRDQYGHFHNAKVNHAVIHVGYVEGRDKPQNVEAAPGGAHFADWDNYGSDMIWVHQWRPKVGTGFGDPIVLTDEQRAKIVEYAVDCAAKKIGYNYKDFIAIAFAQQRFHGLVKYDQTQQGWLMRKAVARLADDNHLICSQLVDASLGYGGLKPFDDNRAHGLVSPRDLMELAVA